MKGLFVNFAERLAAACAAMANDEILRAAVWSQIEAFFARNRGIRRDVESEGLLTVIFFEATEARPLAAAELS